MLKLAGYADRLSVRPGETIEFKVSSMLASPYQARFVRVICGDPNPAGPGLLEEPVAATIEGLHDSRVQPVHLGSYAAVDAAVLPAAESFTVVTTVCPTLLGKNESTVLAIVDDAEQTLLCIVLDAEGQPQVRYGTVHISGPQTFAEDRWYRLWLSYDGAAGRLVLGCCPLARGRAAGEPVVAAVEARHTGLAGASKVFIAGRAEGDDPSRFNGRIEHPAIFDRPLTRDEVEGFAAGGPIAGLLAHWDFSREISSTRIVDVGPHGLHGRLVNLPARAMTGSNWSGREMCWRHALGEYAAIHFHDDDLYDCGWETSFSWIVPPGLRSGLYAVRLTGEGEEDNIPFVVVPPKGSRTADVCVLMSTYTWTVYHNHFRPEAANPEWMQTWKAQARAWGGYPHNPGEHPEYGLSTYNFHRDGSGICHASWLRPMLNVRLGYITYPDEKIRGSGLRHLPADTHLLAWLEAKGYAYDVISDEELDREGLDLIEPYRVVVTGSHPEYHTAAMLDALRAYRDGGGRLMYLGGNGFYWKVARHRELPGAIEIRRGEGGIRAWAAEPGEYYNAFDGEYGGLWRRNGRPPQDLVGVGFTAQGNFVGSYYRRRPEAADPRVAWILQGVDADKLGDFGLSGHGAAGFELDRTDKRLGTPDHAVVLASSEGHDPEAPWVLVPEEQLTHIVTWAGQPAKSLIRADLTFFEAPNNGAVFSTGSITFCGCLPAKDFDNPISRLTQNVLDRFLDPSSTFPLPVR